MTALGTKRDKIGDKIGGKIGDKIGDKNWGQKSSGLAVPSFYV